MKIRNLIFRLSYHTIFFITAGIFTGHITIAQEETWNLAVGMAVDASGYSQGFPPENAIAANSPLCWTVEGGGKQWFEIRFDEPVFIERFSLTFGHPYEGEPLLIFGRDAEGNYSLLQKFENENLQGDSLLDVTLPQTWENIEFIRLESPESPLYMCWLNLGLIGYIPGRIPPAQGFPCVAAPDLIYYNANIIIITT